MQHTTDTDPELAELERRLERRAAAFQTFLRVRAVVGLVLMVAGAAGLTLSLMAVGFLAFDVSLPGVSDAVAALGAVAAVVLPALGGLVAWRLGRFYWRGRNASLTDEP